jgi:AcrR family transcriptional regulator
MAQAKSWKRPDLARERLIEAVGEVIGSRGWAKATIADVVEEARVSKRTFYEHFKDLEACFLEAYGVASEQILAAIAGAVDPAAPWQQQIRAAVKAYLGALEMRPLLARAFLLEVQAAGPRALKTRHQVHEAFARQIRGFVDEARKRDQRVKTLSPLLAAALVGGLNELVILHIESDAHGFSSLAPVATEFAMAVLGTGVLY